MGDMQTALNILVGNPEGKRPLGIRRCRWEMILKWVWRMRCEVVEWIHLAKYKA